MATAVTPVPQAKVSSSTPFSYVLTLKVLVLICSTKFTLLPGTS